MSSKKNILWTTLVLIPIITGISVTTSAWVVCKNVIPDEYMDLSSVTEQDTQKTIFRKVATICHSFVGDNAALYVSGPISLPASRQRSHSGPRTSLSVACTSVGQRAPRETDQLYLNAFISVHSLENSSNRAFPSYIANISLNSEQSLTVILRI